MNTMTKKQIWNDTYRQRFVFRHLQEQLSGLIVCTSPRAPLFSRRQSIKSPNSPELQLLFEADE